MVRERVRRPDPPEPAPPQLMDGAQPVNTERPQITAMGIDPSLTGTGIAVIKDGQLVAQTLAPKKLRHVHRLKWFRFELIKILNAYEPDIVAIEGYGFGAKNSHAHSLGELGGVLKLALLDCMTDYLVVPPTSLKMFVTGKGNSPKTVMGKELYKRFEIDLDDDNQVDAAGLAMMALAWVDGFTLTQCQSKALKKVVEMGENNFVPGDT